jgi:hypothetical protein
MQHKVAVKRWIGEMKLCLLMAYHFEAIIKRSNLLSEIGPFVIRKKPLRVFYLFDLK